MRCRSEIRCRSGCVSNPSVDAFRMNYCFITEQHQPAAETSLLPDDFPLELAFSSGAGAWATGLTLNRDGTFTGGYRDSNMGEIGNGYPNGTVFYCNFEGSFEIVGQVDEYTYSLRLVELVQNDVPGTERIEDGVRYVATEPYGLEDGTEFLLYLPGTPHELLTEDFQSWNLEMLYGGETDALSGYGLRNVAIGYGFFGK